MVGWGGIAPDLALVSEGFSFLVFREKMRDMRPYSFSFFCWVLSFSLIDSRWESICCLAGSCCDEDLDMPSCCWERGMTVD